MKLNITIAYAGMFQNFWKYTQNTFFPNKNKLKKWKT